LQWAEFVTYFSLFIVAMLAATVLPGSSEALLLGLVAKHPAETGALLITATLGNTLGGVINWTLGCRLSRFSSAPWFPVSAERLARACRLFQRYGSWTLLFSWLPIIGDPLTVAAGLLRVPFGLFLLLVGLGKASRYLLLIGGLRLFM
jgi:membrane protein YqaA with SNARE-associated domain